MLYYGFSSLLSNDLISLNAKKSMIACTLDNFNTDMADQDYSDGSEGRKIVFKNTVEIIRNEIS